MGCAASLAPVTSDEQGAASIDFLPVDPSNSRRCSCIPEDQLSNLRRGSCIPEDQLSKLPRGSCIPEDQLSELQRRASLDARAPSTVLANPSLRRLSAGFMSAELFEKQELSQGQQNLDLVSRKTIAFRSWLVPGIQHSVFCGFAKVLRQKLGLVVELTFNHLVSGPRKTLADDDPDHKEADLGWMCATAYLDIVAEDEAKQKAAGYIDHTSSEQPHSPSSCVMKGSGSEMVPKSAALIGVAWSPNDDSLNGEAIYFSEVICHPDRPPTKLVSLEDLRGLKVGCNDLSSLSGYHGLQITMMEAGLITETQSASDFCDVVLTGGHLVSLAELDAGTIDVAIVDTVTLITQRPEWKPHLRLGPWPTQPLIGNTKMHPSQRQCIKEVLLATNDDPVMRETLVAAGIRRLVHVDSENYAGLKQRYNQLRKLHQLQTRAGANPDWDYVWHTLLPGSLFDNGASSPSLTAALSALPMGRCLTPGGGRGYDAFVLADRGCEVVNLELSRQACSHASAWLAHQRKPEKAGTVEVACGNFFQYGEARSFDLLWDCTFLCALDPACRLAWAAKSVDLLKAGGILGVVVFPIMHNGTEYKSQAGMDLLSKPGQGPPFELSVDLIRQLLKPHGCGLLNVLQDVPRHSTRDGFGFDTVVALFQKPLAL